MVSTRLIVTQLLLKRAEIEAQIKSAEARIDQARADLLHVAATVRPFDPTASANTASDESNPSLRVTASRSFT